MSPGFVADEHLEGPPGKREFIIGCLISKVKKYLAANNNRKLFRVLRRRWLPCQEWHLGGVEVELLDQGLLVVSNVVGVLLWRQPGQVRLELTDNLLLVVRQVRQRPAWACGGQPWL